MIRTIAKALGMFALALALALISAWWMIFHTPRSLAVGDGPWRTSTVIGGTDADLYTRAVVAITGLFALNRSETIYFSAEESDTHQKLRARCSYVVEGKPLDARWWSLDDLRATTEPFEPAQLPELVERHRITKENQQ